MTRDEALAKAVEAASAYERERRPFTGCHPIWPSPAPPDWKAPDMGHILAALRALGLLKLDDTAADVRALTARGLALDIITEALEPIAHDPGEALLASRWVLQKLQKLEKHGFRLVRK
jgi:hypothetical protein